MQPGLLREDSRVSEFIETELKRASMFGSALTLDQLNYWKWYDIEPLEIERELAELCSRGRVVTDGSRYTLSSAAHLLESSDERIKRAQAASAAGRKLLSEIIQECSGILFCGISGSVSYGSSGSTDDIDIVLVTADGHLWQNLRKALLMARRSMRGEFRDRLFCFSYCMERSAFESECSMHRTRLFASDFLHIDVVAGMEYYSDVLIRCEWMGQYYPHAYRSRMTRSCNGHNMGGQGDDRLDYLLVGSYLKLWALARNANYRIRGMESQAFDAVITRDRCIYASRKWRMLEDSFRA